MQVGVFMREVRQELAKVIWPKRGEIIAMTITVLVFVTIIALFFVLIDSVISDVIETIIVWGRSL